MYFASKIFINICSVQYLDHQITISNRQAGIIFPPLPAKPAADPAGAEVRSRKQLGSGARSMLGDGSQWTRDCQMLEKYLEMIVDHPVSLYTEP